MQQDRVISDMMPREKEEKKATTKDGAQRKSVPELFRDRRPFFRVLSYHDCHCLQRCCAGWAHGTVTEEGAVASRRPLCATIATDATVQLLLRLCSISSLCSDGYVPRPSGAIINYAYAWKRRLCRNESRRLFLIWEDMIRCRKLHLQR
jgi:hypothetical protein